MMLTDSVNYLNGGCGCWDKAGADPLRPLNYGAIRKSLMAAASRVMLASHGAVSPPDSTAAPTTADLILERLERLAEALERPAWQHCRTWLADHQWDANHTTMSAEGWELVAVIEGPKRYPEGAEIGAGSHPGKWYFWRRRAQV